MSIYYIPGAVRAGGDVVINDLIAAGNASVAGAVSFDGTSVIIGSASSDKVGVFGNSSTQLATIAVATATGVSLTGQETAIEALIDRLQSYGFIA